MKPPLGKGINTSRVYFATIIEVTCLGCDIDIV
jgi:hypothetical protein